MRASPFRASIPILVVAISVLGGIFTAIWAYRAGRSARVAFTPRVGFVQQEVDLGFQPWGHELPAALVFENRTDQAVVIDKVFSSCDCTTVASEQEGRIIPSHSELPIAVLLKTGDRAGPRASYISLRLRDQRAFTAAVKAQITGEWWLSQDRVDFGRVLLNSANPPQSRVIFNSRSSVLLGNPASPDPWLVCEYEPVADDPSATAIVLRIDSNKLPPGVSHAYLRFKTDNATVPNGVIPVLVQGVTELSALPQRAFVQPGGSVQVRFVDDSRAYPELVSASTHHPDLTTTILKPGLIEVCADQSATIPGNVPVCALCGAARHKEAAPAMCPPTRRAARIHAPLPRRTVSATILGLQWDPIPTRL